MNILITSLSRKVPLLAAFRKAIEQRPGAGVLWGADSDPECVGGLFCDRFWEMPSLSDPGARETLAGFCADQEIGLLVPTRDGELTVLAQMRGELAEAGTHVPVGAPEAVEVCLDKLSFFRHCSAAGLPTAPTSVVLDELGGDRFVVKDRRGAGARAIAVGVDRRRAREHGEGLEEPLYQPLLSGIEHSVDVYVNRAGAVVEAAPRIRLRVHDGESTVTETVEHPELLEIAVRLAESLDLRGHLVIQAFVDGSDVRLLECNARVGGASTLGFAAGVDTPRWCLAEAAGETIEPRRGGYRRGLRLVRYPADHLVER